MLSRRVFLLGQLAGIASLTNALDPLSALAAKKAKPAAVNIAGPHSMARENWPPAIIPDHVGLADKGFCCFADDFGRLAIVDLRKPTNAKTPPKLVAELAGIGKKVIDFKVGTTKGYALVMKETGTETSLAIACINLTPATSPSVQATIPLTKYSDATSLAVSGDSLCVAGTSTSGENLVTIYSGAKGSFAGGVTPSQIALDLPVTAMSLQDRKLVVLENGGQCKLEVINLTDPSTPEVVSGMKLDGDFRVLGRIKNMVFVAGSTYATDSGGKGTASCTFLSIALESSKPRVVSQCAVTPIVNVLDASIQNGRALVLGEGPTDRSLVSVLIDNKGNVHADQVVQLPKPRGSYGVRSSVLLTSKSAYVASGWSGVQVLALNGNTWSHIYDYSIPRLPASSIAAWGDRVVLAGSDLKLYDISSPTHPSLITTTDTTTATTEIVGAGSFVMCLGHEGVTLRKMDKLSDVLASLSIKGQRLTFDKIKQKGYLLSSDEKKSTLTVLSVYSNSIVKDKVFDFPAPYTSLYSNGGMTVLAGIHDVALIDTNQGSDVVGSRHIENLAIRDICFTDNCVVVSAVDENSKGFLLLLSKDKKELLALGSVELPHNGLAIAALGNTAIAIGSTTDGQDLASVIDISKPAVPKVLTTIKCVESASAVILRDKMALVAGRGLELISLA